MLVDRTFNITLDALYTYAYYNDTHIFIHTMLRDILYLKFWLAPELTRFIYSSGLSNPRSWRVLELSSEQYLIRTTSATGALNSVSSNIVGNFTLCVCLLPLSSTFPCSTGTYWTRDKGWDIRFVKPWYGEFIAFRSGAVEVSVLLGYAPRHWTIDDWLIFKGRPPLKMRPLHCLKATGTNRPLTRRRISKERRLQLDWYSWD